MSVPQSLLVVALAVAWLVVLVPSSARRRGHVHQTVEGSGFRVLHRQPAAGRRSFRRPAAPSTVGKTQSEDEMASQQADVAHTNAEDDTVVLDAVEAEHAVQAEYAGREGTNAVADLDDPAQLTLVGTERVTAGSTAYFTDEPSSDAGVDEADQPAPGSGGGEFEDADEAELRRQYQAWRESTRPAAPPAEDDGSADVEPDNVRPIPRSPGRGTYDPDAAERARAYKFARRRRTLMILVLLVVAFGVLSVLVSPTLWIGAGLSVVLLMLFLAYLRRQVKIEADIRDRRLAKLQRARQIRPERPRTADQIADPYAQRAPRPQPASGPVPHRSNRVVLELDDDDPGFDDLEQYEPMEYRRAVGQ